MLLGRMQLGCRGGSGMQESKVIEAMAWIGYYLVYTVSIIMALAMGSPPTNPHAAWAGRACMWRIGGCTRDIYTSCLYRLGHPHLTKTKTINHQDPINWISQGTMLAEPCWNISRRLSPVPAPSWSGRIFSEQKNNKNKTTNLFRTNSAKWIWYYPK